MSYGGPQINQLKEQQIQPETCRALWCAVISEHWGLATAPRKSDRPHEIASARRWFGSRDFFAVCALAGVDGAWVMEGYRAWEALYAAERAAGQSVRQDRVPA